jgi:radical SAM protein with 4Fe4S-binding SPASM domain
MQINDVEKKWIDTKNSILSNIQYYKNIPLFSAIEINLSNTCNRKCEFCPEKKDEPEFMTVATHDTFVYKLTFIKYSGLIGYSGFSEPMMHKLLNYFIYSDKKRLPQSKVVVTTNGDFLDDTKITDIFAAGLDILTISLYDGQDQFDRFTKMIEKHELQEKVFLRKRYSGSEEIRMFINNRASYFKSEKDLPLNKCCYYPFYMLYIDWNGDILFCSNDFQKQVILGNIEKNSLIDCWNRQKLNNIKKNLSLENRNHLPCSGCDVGGDVMGRESYEAWSKYENSRSS